MMKTKHFTLIMLVAAATIRAEVGDELAASAADAHFKVKTTPLVISSAAQLASLPWEVTWRAGETVTAVDRDGNTVPIVNAAAADGTAPFSFVDGKAGVWRLCNSVSGEAKFGVAWTAYEGVGTVLASSSFNSRRFIDSKQLGPNRRMFIDELRAIAYAGNGWLDAASGACTLTVTNPEQAETVTNLTGTGTVAFRPNRLGVWTASFAYPGGTLLSSIYVRRRTFAVIIK